MRVNDSRLRREILPGVHPTVHDGIVHRVGHCQPVECQINVLDVRRRGQFRHVRCDDKVYVVRKPTDRENRHHDNHHFDDLQAN